MKGHIFTAKEREELSGNPHISKVLNSNIEYTEEFKQRALYEHQELGKSAEQIFEEAGLPAWLNRKGYAKSALKRWRKQQFQARKPRGRPALDIDKPIEEMSLEELKMRIDYLELENEFLKNSSPWNNTKTRINNNCYQG